MAPVYQELVTFKVCFTSLRILDHNPPNLYIHTNRSNPRFYESETCML